MGGLSTLNDSTIMFGAAANNIPEGLFGGLRPVTEPDSDLRHARAEVP
jgi:hypothetical protein